MDIVTYDQVNSKIITVQNQNVIIDSELATLYGVETRELNQPVSRKKS